MYSYFTCGEINVQEAMVLMKFYYQEHAKYCGSLIPKSTLVFQTGTSRILSISPPRHGQRRK